MNKPLMMTTLALACAASALADSPAERHADWQLVFHDDFNGTTLDTDNWSRIAYVNGKVSDWRRYQSQDSELVHIGVAADGTTAATLWGRYGDYTSQNDQSGAADGYACGGITTLGTFSFQYGYVEVRARFDSVQGVWPAIWMMPTTAGTWPDLGEIDIMEHLNYEGSVYQTLHSSNASNGQDTGKVGVHPDFASYGTTKGDWNTYGMEWTAEGINFYLNGSLTATYTRQGTNDWPFDDPGNTFYLIIDQQIGGTWVEGAGSGGIDRATLAQGGAALELDYVKVYSTANYRHMAAVPEPAAAALSLLALAVLAARRRR